VEFSLGVLPGVILGLLSLQIKFRPRGRRRGKYALLLGTSVYGLMICFAGFCCRWCGSG
jgi:hypothetical protein